MTESALIGFASLFLGLTSGPQPIEFVVHEPVVEVRVVLDGSEVGRLDGSPWETLVDFGEALVPHRLDIEGLDSGGQPIATATQWVNLPREQAEIEVAIVTDQRGRGVGATLAYRAVRPVPPESLRVTLDGAELTVTDPHHLAFPPVSLDEPHVLRADVTFPGELSASTTEVFGGTYVDTTEAELTAVPLIRAQHRRLPNPRQLSSTLTLAGAVVPVMATERPAPRIVLVVDERALGAIRDIVLPPEDPQEARFFVRREKIWATRLRAGVHAGRAELDVVDAVPDQSREDRILTQNTFTCRSYAKFDLDDLTVFLAQTPPRPIAPESQWLQAATASAGLAAARGNVPRVVVLILGAADVDDGDYSPAAVRSFLEYLNVPLRVWSPFPEVAGQKSPWGPVRDISSIRAFVEASADAVEDAEEQFIAWVDGEHLPQSIGLVDPAGEFRIAR